MLEKPKLFADRKSALLVVALLLSVIGLRLIGLYADYAELIKKPFYYTNATVLNSYPKTKNGRSYTVLKLQSREGWQLFTSTYRTDVLRGQHLRLQIFPGDAITFWGFLGNFYVKSRIVRSDSPSPSLHQKLTAMTAAQHEEPTLQSFYNAIFFAIPLMPSLRKQVSRLGISHLVALSGFHLAILWGVVYGALLMLYRPLQQRFFPYRFALIDVGVVAILLLGFYVWFVDMPPSLVRSYAMVLIGWAILLLGIELLDFSFLGTVLLLLLAIFPTLLASIGFWFSVAGVFYIYLILKYTKAFRPWVISIVFIPIGIFLLMLPIVHGLFGATTPYQLLSPILSLAFIPFYPLVILLHLFGAGDWLDNVLHWLFSLPKASVEHLLYWPYVSAYIAVSLAAIRYRLAFGLVLTSAVVFAGYIFV